MNEQNYEREVNLGKLLYRVLREWRRLLAIAAVVAVLAGAGSLALKCIRMYGTEYLEKAQEDYRRELAAYEAAGENLRREIANLEETRTQREAYNENSVLMKINPYRECNASLQLYIATDYQIVPDLTYQNPDLSSRILRSYLTYMGNGDMYQYVLERLSSPMELRYLKEILSVSADYDSRMISLDVRNVDAVSCEEVLRYALEGLTLKKDEITAAVGKHELNAVNRSAYESVDLDLDTWQKGNIQYVSELSIRMQEKAVELTEWLKTPKPQPEYTMERTVKNAVKTAALGFLIGGVLAAALAACRYILSDKVQDAGDLKSRFGLRVIAQVPKAHGKRAWAWLDRVVAKMGGLELKERDAGALARLAARSVAAELEATGEAGRKIVFTGTLPAEEIERLLSAMEWGEGCSVRGVPGILSDPSAVARVMEADYVVLVEKQEESTYVQIARELEELAAWKKTVLGFIVVGVDAVP